MICPVCNTENTTDTVHCKTCNWYFPLKNTQYFDLELSKARQNWQMVSSFNQVFQHMQIQSKMLEKMSFRLDGLENEMTALKENKPRDVEIQQKYDYPALEPIMRAENFDTPEKRKIWWDGLEEQWKKAFKLAVLNKSEYHECGDEDFKFTLESEVVRFVGPRGMHPNIDFELTNLSGLKHLTNLKILVASHNALEHLEDIEYLDNLESLFANSNKLSNIKSVYYLPKLKKLYLNANQIGDILPVQPLINLETLYCCYNQLSSLHGVTSKHQEKLVEFVCLPNDKVTQQEILRVEDLGIICKKG